MNNLIIKFLKGNIPLWKSYWIVGELLNALVVLLVLNFEIRFFDNQSIVKNIPFIVFDKFSFLSKIIIILWTTFITIGIWKSAEQYKGLFLWVALTLIFLSYRIFTLRVLLLY